MRGMLAKPDWSLAMVLLLALAPLPALACGCGKPRTPAEVQHFVHLFKGQVRTVSTTGERQVAGSRPNYASPVRQTVVFEVIEMLAGPAAATVQVEFGGSTSCDLEEPSFVPGQVYLISDLDILRFGNGAGTSGRGEPEPTGRYSAHFCSLRELLGTAPSIPLEPGSGDGPE